jgi:hypothetical protein
MSLINDALRRAKQAQKEAPPSNPTPISEFRPVEAPVQAARHGLGLLVPVSLGLVALMALLLLWELTRRGPATGAPPTGSALDVAARTAPAESTAAAVPAELPATHGTQSVGSNTGTGKPTSANAPESIASAPEHSNNLGAANSASSTNLASGPTEGLETNHVAAEPAPAPLRLQSIVYNPRRPSALISGRVLFIGDKIKDLRVTAIHSTDVVLTGTGSTNVLSLDP